MLIQAKLFRRVENDERKQERKKESVRKRKEKCRQHESKRERKALNDSVNR